MKDMKKEIKNQLTAKITGGTSNQPSPPHARLIWPGFAALLVLLCVLFYFWFGLLLFLTGCRGAADETAPLAMETSLQESVADEVLRLHIIADSNSDADQQVKLLVKEAVLTYLKPCLEGVTTKKEAIDVISGQLNDLSRTASQVLREQGFSYSAAAELTRSYFPIKTYGDLRLPAGEYDALKIRLGSASGKNWWCLVFPQLCFADLTYGVLPEESREELRALLTEDEFRLLFSEEDKAALSFPESAAPLRILSAEADAAAGPASAAQTLFPAKYIYAGWHLQGKETASAAEANALIVILPDEAYLSARLAPVTAEPEDAPAVRFWIAEQLKKLFE